MIRTFNAAVAGASTTTRRSVVLASPTSPQARRSEIVSSWRIFITACERLEIVPSQAVFLDDIGSNLKTARSLGMTTIKVVEPDAALAELEPLLGFSLR